MNLGSVIFANQGDVGAPAPDSGFETTEVLSEAGFASVLADVDTTLTDSDQAKDLVIEEAISEFALVENQADARKSALQTDTDVVPLIKKSESRYDGSKPEIPNEYLSDEVAVGVQIVFPALFQESTGHENTVDRPQTEVSLETALEGVRTLDADTISPMGLVLENRVSNSANTNEALPFRARQLPDTNPVEAQRSSTIALQTRPTATFNSTPNVETTSAARNPSNVTDAVPNTPTATSSLK